jgi:hypothetical protein
MTASAPYTGGCQCGAVRFRAGDVGRASLCHCRMCQKAFGGFYGPLVTALGLEWTRGSPKHFASSNQVRRGFCADCGTPLTYEYEGGIDLAIGAFDEPERVAPIIQLNPRDKLAFVDGIPALPTRPPGENAETEAFFTTIVSHQHPDHDTGEWRAPKEQQ